jgi:hypothetical protein
MALVDDDQLVGRALYEPQWDENVNRSTPSAFGKGDTSVTKLLPLGEGPLISLLKSEVEKGSVVVKGIGLISVSCIKQAGEKAVPLAHYFQVPEMPTPTNPDHAEIHIFEDKACASKKNKVPKGICKKITKALEILVLDSSGKLIFRNPPIVD